MAPSQSEALKSAIASNSEIPTAALSFTSPITDAINSSTSSEILEKKLSGSWGAVIDIAAKTEHGSQGPLVEILRVVQQQRISDAEKSKTVTIWNEQMKVWEDMPLFGATPKSGSRNDFSSEDWTNLNAFSARLTALSLSLSIPAFDFSLYGIWTMRSAFESSPADAASVEAAKVWFLYAGETIEKLSREERSFDGRMARVGEKIEGKEWKGFSEERLAVWKAG